MSISLVVVVVVVIVVVVVGHILPETTELYTCEKLLRIVHS